VRAESVPSAGQWIKLVANESECKAMADRADIKGIKSLEAKIHLLPKNSGHVIEVRGSFCADVIQECAITLEQIESHIEEEFSAWYANYHQAASFTRAQHEMQSRLTAEEQPMMEEQDDPEPMIDGCIDVADLVAQYLVLAINPYVRVDGVEAETDSPPKQTVHGTIRPNPFAALKNWRPKD